MKRALLSVGIGIVVIVASWALFLDVAILYEASGPGIAVVGIALAPITYLAVPIYAGAALGNWLPFFVGYGSAIVGLLLARSARRLSHDRSRTGRDA